MVLMEKLLRKENFPVWDLDLSKFVNQVIECALGTPVPDSELPDFESNRRDVPDPDAVLKRVTVIYLSEENRKLLGAFVNAWIQRNPDKDYNVNQLLNFMVQKALTYIARKPAKT